MNKEFEIEESSIKIAPFFIGLSLAVVVIAEISSVISALGCGFVNVAWVDRYEPATGPEYAEDNWQFETTSGVLFCKYIGLSGFGGPTNAIDVIAALCAFLAPFIGVFVIITMSIQSCSCCGCGCLNLTEMSNKISAGILGSCFVFQILTLLVLVAPACSDAYQGECHLLPLGYISIFASFMWLFGAAATLKRIQQHEV